ncbi:MAG TPA: PTS sugar transporter subunit IIA [Gemmatimonadales bacterium]|jgi:mannitol/fructose-specific phosphotransferase system IIA component (Ntr-type)|nr:PTS sugar transporter subunit IIA [Gemmatimonadales bacterium]
MRLRELFTEGSIDLALKESSKDEILGEMIGLLGLDPAANSILFKIAKRRENLGSTGVGRGVAIPHCRSPVVDRLRLAFGRTAAGVDYQGIDNLPVHFLFLIVAPPPEVSNQYLPVLGKIAQFVKEEDVPERLLQVQSPEEFLALLDEKGV